MKFTKKMREFNRAYRYFAQSKREFSIPLLASFEISTIYEMKYLSPRDGKLNLRSDFITVGGDMKKAAKEAEEKLKNGKTTTSE